MKNLLYALGIASSILISGDSLSQENKNYNLPKQTIENYQKNPADTIKKFIYIPSANIYVAKEKTHFDKNWFECHEELQKNKERMLTLPEFIEFLKYLKSSNKAEFLNLYKNITDNKDPWKSEWIDADFKTEDWVNVKYINYYHVLDSSGNLIPKKSEILDNNTLNTFMQEEYFPLDIENWVDSNHTSQGLPTKNVKKGRGAYWGPVPSNKSVASYSARSGANWTGFGCNDDPLAKDPGLGARAVRERK